MLTAGAISLFLNITGAIAPVAPVLNTPLYQDTLKNQIKLVTIYKGRNVDDKIDDKIDDKVTNTVKFTTFEPLTSTERLSTVSSPYMVVIYAPPIQSFFLINKYICNYFF